MRRVAEREREREREFSGYNDGERHGARVLTPAVARGSLGASLTMNLLAFSCERRAIRPIDSQNVEALNALKGVRQRAD